jgi:hypothetical protein
MKCFQLSHSDWLWRNRPEKTCFSMLIPAKTSIKAALLMYVVATRDINTVIAGF